MPKQDRTREMIGLMINELLAGPATKQELQDASGLADSTVREWVGAWLDPAVRALRIDSFESIRNGQVVKPIYALNPEGKPDARRPRPRGGRDRSARYRARKVLKAAGADEAALRALTPLLAPRS